MKKFLFVFLVLAVFSTAEAHKLNLLALYEGGTLNISSYFGDGTFCKRCPYTVTAQDGHVLFKGTLSNKGEAVLSGELPSVFFVSVDAGMGHFAKAEVTNVSTSSGSNAGSNVESAQAFINEDALKNIIRQELARQTVELQIAIDAGNSRTDKIIAGLGYLFGIFGLFVLFRKK